MCSTLYKLHFWNRGRIQARKKNKWKASSGSFSPVTVCNSPICRESEVSVFRENLLHGNCKSWRYGPITSIDVPLPWYSAEEIESTLPICKKFLRANMKVLHNLCWHISLVKITNNTVSNADHLVLINSLSRMLSISLCSLKWTFLTFPVRQICIKNILSLWFFVLLSLGEKKVNFNPRFKIQDNCYYSHCLY